MTGPLFAEELSASGLDPLEQAAKARLYDAVLAEFQRRFGVPPEHASWVPGRLEVFGTHTDYAGGRTIVSALPRGFAFVARRRDDGRLHVVDAIRGDSMRIVTPSRAGAAGASRWHHYVGVVVERLVRNFPGAALGADVVFGSDLPGAAGMSSSSGLMVGVATTLVRLSALRARPEWQGNVTSPLDEAGYYACIENGRTFGSLAGDAGVGTHGGSEDHAAMLCSTAGAMSAFAFVPMRHLETIRLPEGWGVVVASSGVAAEKTGGALEPYNRLARGAGILLDLWNQSEAPAASLASALRSSPSAAARLHKIVRSTPIPGWSAPGLEARLQHFIQEDARIPEAISAFRDLDARQVHKLAAASQADAEELLRNQVDHTVALTRLAIDRGAFAARSFGAGFGGSVWALVDRQAAPAFAAQWLEAYRAKFPNVNAVGFVAQPGPAVVELGGPQEYARERFRGH